MLLCTCLALNPHVTRHAKLKLITSIGLSNVANASYNNFIVEHISSMTTL